MPGKKVIIVGAGIGGLTTAIYLARHGFSVKVLEKNNFAGGRCSSLKKDGHSFDTGATLLMMTDIYKKTWASFGKDIFEELDLIRMEPIYSIRFSGDKEFRFSSDLSKMQSQLEEIETGSFARMLNYLDDSYKVYKLSMKYIIDKDFRKATQFFNIKNLFLLFKMHVFQNHYKQASGYFKNELLRTTFTFQNIYVGQNPFKASAIFAMLPFLELTDGVWYPRGGMSQISQNLLSIAIENGVEIKFNSEVTKILTNANKTSGVVLQDGEISEGDLVVCNGDLPYVYNNLLPDQLDAKKMSSKEHTCSAIIFHWGLKKVYPQFEQHNVYVSDNYRENLNAVFEDKGIPDDTSFYVHAPARSDSSAAPENQDSITVLVPVSHINQNGGQNWMALRDKARELVFKRLASEGITDISDHIKFELVYNPRTWENIFHVSKGSVFGSLSHKIMQMGYMRPHNQHSKYRNLFFVGGSTHPGNGIPMVLLSAKHTTNAIFNFTKSDAKLA